MKTEIFIILFPKFLLLQFRIQLEKRFPEEVNGLIFNLAMKKKASLQSNFSQKKTKILNKEIKSSKINFYFIFNHKEGSQTWRE